MCGPHTSQSSSAASHPTYGPAKAAGRSQTRPVEVLGIQALLSLFFVRDHDMAEWFITSGFCDDVFIIMQRRMNDFTFKCIHRF